MKLLELIGVKKYQDKTMDELGVLLTTMTPYKGAGFGLFSRVFKKDNKLYKFWMGDSAYDKFLDYVVKHQDNPCLPKVLSKIRTMKVFFKRHKKTPDVLKHVQLEELKPVTDKTKIKAHSGGQNGLGAYEPEEVEIYAVRSALATAEKDVGKGADKIYEKAVKYLNKELEYDQVKDPNLINILKTVAEIISLPAIEPDLHSGNFMMRGDHQLVIIDPGVVKEDRELMSWLKDLKLHGDESTADIVSGTKKTN